MSGTPKDAGGPGAKGGGADAGAGGGSASPGTPRANRLADSTSPYLLQHAHNPVDWYPWGPEALERARREDKPILLSIGYAACHWCHVMEHESFEDPGIAALMNAHFVCIKVDREERPDLDEIYMSAVQLMTGSGGWPMTMFLTPDLQPFYGGTYFPPDDRYGRPGMTRLIPEVARIYREQRNDVAEQAAHITKVVGSMTGATADDEPPPPGRGGAPASEPPALSLALVDRAARQYLAAFDVEWGGFGGAPKFPPSAGISLLLRYHRRAGDRDVPVAVRTTLERMALGGMYDQVGGGFARYSVDDRWHVPHFEKMLYDNALLVSTYAEALRALGDDAAGTYRRVIMETLEFAERELGDPAGGFYSSLDADSEGEEGKFYVWTLEELREALGDDDAEFFAAAYACEAGGNWESGVNIPWRPHGPATPEEETRLKPLRARLLAARAARIRPGTDDKVLAAWNGLMISALCHAAQALDEPAYAARAARCAEFVLREMTTGGRLLRSWRRGRAHLTAYSEDYAFVAAGLIDLYETTFDSRWLTAATDLADTALKHYGDAEQGGFRLTADDGEALLHRPRSAYDGATPSGNSVMAEVLLRLAALRGRADLQAAAQRTVAAFAGRLQQVPAAHLRMLTCLEWWDGASVEIALVGDPAAPATRALMRAAWGAHRPAAVLALRAPAVDAAAAAELDALIPLLAGKTAVGGLPAAYVCRNFTCAAPVTSAEELTAALAAPAR